MRTLPRIKMILACCFTTLACGMSFSQSLKAVGSTTIKVIGGTNLVLDNANLNIQASATLTSEGNLRIDGAIINAGTIQENNGTIISSSITNSGSISLEGATIDINGDITNNGPLDLNASSLAVAGTITNTNSFIEGTSQITFDGTSDQMINGITTIYHLILNKVAGDLIAFSPLEVSNELELQNGLFTTTSANKLTLNTGAILSGGSVNSHVTGPFQIFSQAGTGDKTLFFPVGKSGEYKPVTFSFNQTDANSSAYTVELQTTGIPNNNLTGQIVETSPNRFWEITYSGSNNFSDLNITLPISGDFNYVNEDKAIIAIENGSDWQAIDIDCSQPPPATDLTMNLGSAPLNDLILARGMRAQGVIGGGASICEGETIDLNFTLSGLEPFDVVYTDGTDDFTLTDISDGFTEVITPVNSNDYTIKEIIDNSGCSILAPSTNISGLAPVIVNPLPTATVSGDATICEGESTDLVFDLTGADPFNLTYNDGTVDLSLNGINDGELESVNPLSTTTYTLIGVTDNNNCQPASITSSVTVIVNPLPSVNLDAQNPFCVDDAATDLTATPAGGTWSGTGITDEVNGTFDPAIALPGMYSITYSVTESGCTTEEMIDIEVLDTPDATVDPAGPLCSADDPITLSALNAGGTWSGDGIIDENAGIFDPGEAGIGNISVSYTLEVGGCTDTQSISINVNESPEVAITAPEQVCIDEIITLSATPSGGSWMGPGITSATNGTFDPSIAGVGTTTITYSITQAGCSGTQEVILEVLPIPGDATSINGQSILCPGDEVTFTTDALSGVEEYQWETPSGVVNTTEPALTFTPSAAGQLTVAGVNSCGTGATASTSYELAPEVTASFSFVNSQSSDLEFLFTDTSSGEVNSWSWNFGDGATSSQQNPSHTYDTQGDYTVSLTRSNGICEDNVSQAVSVTTEISVRIGNVITPNNNGQNDFIYIENIEKYPDHEVQLLNRWGKEVFSTTRFSNNVEEMSGIPDLRNGNYVCRVIIRFGGSEVQQQQVISVIE